MWLNETTARERRTLIAGFLGYGLDGFDFMIYTFVIPTLLAAWGMTNAEAGYIATSALITSAIGGWAAGVMADRFGRIRMLQLTVVWFAAFTFLSGFTHSYWGLLFTRAMQGFGFRRRVGGRVRADRRDVRRASPRPGLRTGAKQLGRWMGRRCRRLLGFVRMGCPPRSPGNVFSGPASRPRC